MGFFIGYIDDLKDVMFVSLLTYLDNERMGLWLLDMAMAMRLVTITMLHFRLGWRGFYLFVDFSALRGKRSLQVKYYVRNEHTQERRNLQKLRMKES